MMFLHHISRKEYNMTILIGIIIFLIGALVGAVGASLFAISSETDYIEQLQDAYEKGREDGMKEIDHGKE